MRAAGRLAHDSVVSTVMSNLGFRQAMQREGVAVVATAVGDRYVLEAMRSFGYTLGGEQSGHLIMSEHATTGDGLLTALHLAAQVARSGKPLADLACGDAAVPAGARERVRTSTSSAWTPRPSPRPWPRRSANSVSRGASCCVPAAPSRSCGSWSRPTRLSVRSEVADRLAAVVRQTIG